MSCGNSGNLPERIRLLDFAGRFFTVAGGAEAWRKISAANGPDVLLLGTGCGNLENLPFIKGALGRRAVIYWLEAPEILDKLRAILPAHTLSPQTGNWRKTDCRTVLEVASSCEIFFHTQAMRLAPDFWGPLLARMQVSAGARAWAAKPEKRLIWLPGNSSQLLHAELLRTLAEAAFETVEGLPANVSLQHLREIWRNRLPHAVISVNFRGLDSEGGIFEICRALNVPVAVWLVDNPWHLLSGIRFPWWKKADLFVSDRSFIKPLKDYGAQKVKFCPLAAAPHMWLKIPSDHDPCPLFAGRSAFPDRDSFFKGLKINPELGQMAMDMLQTGTQLPDYHWWTKNLRTVLWPGNAGRLPGFCADTFSALNRAAWLRAALKRDLRIIGDAGWREFLPEAEILPPVDYYGGMGKLYRDAACVLNVTSLLLPESLNQRHFDVFAAGGLLLTDASKGLDIFPAGLTREITLAQPEDFGYRLDFFNRNASIRQELVQAWREELQRHHLYRHRLEFILQAIEE